jgi:putative hydrolases of HD superfamily
VKDSDTEIAKFFYELGQLKRVKRSGWWIAGVKDPESVAEHSFRTASIAYILARIEGVNPERTALIALFHDVPEARTNDIHRITRRYADWKGVDQKAIEEQAQRLPEAIGRRIGSFVEELEEENSPEARVARDADLLECLIQAREYQAIGYRDVADWIVNAGAALKTASARKIARACVKTEPREWWQGLKANQPPSHSPRPVKRRNGQTEKQGGKRKWQKKG